MSGQIAEVPGIRKAAAGNDTQRVFCSGHGAILHGLMELSKGKRHGLGTHGLPDGRMEGIVYGADCQPLQVSQRVDFLVVGGLYIAQAVKLPPEHDTIFFTGGAFPVLNLFPMGFRSQVVVQGKIGKGIGLLVLWLVVVIARQIIEPKIVSKRVGLYPLVTLFFMWMGLKVFGGVGMLALPVIVLVIKDLYESGILNMFTVSTAPATVSAGEGSLQK